MRDVTDITAIEHLTKQRRQRSRWNIFQRNNTSHQFITLTGLNATGELSWKIFHGF